MLLECLTLLCQRRVIREELRKRKVYIIVRNLDDVAGKSNEDIRRIILEIVNFLVRDDISAEDEGREEVELREELSISGPLVQERTEY